MVFERCTNEVIGSILIKQKLIFFVSKKPKPKQSNWSMICVTQKAIFQTLVIQKVAKDIPESLFFPKKNRSKYLK